MMIGDRVAVVVSDKSALCLGDSCTTEWDGNGEMIVVGFDFDYDQPVNVSRVSDNAIFWLLPSELVTYKK